MALICRALTQSTTVILCRRQGMGVGFKTWQVLDSGGPVSPKMQARNQGRQSYDACMLLTSSKLRHQRRWKDVILLMTVRAFVDGNWPLHDALFEPGLSNIQRQFSRGRCLLQFSLRMSVDAFVVTFSYSRSEHDYSIRLTFFIRQNQ